MKRLKGNNVNLTALVTLVALSLLVGGCSRTETTKPISKPDASLTEHTMQVLFTTDESGYPTVESAQAI